MKGKQETYLADHVGPHHCSACRVEFTTVELIEDPGVWHVEDGWTIICDACNESIRTWAQQGQEEAQR